MTKVMQMSQKEFDDLITVVESHYHTLTNFGDKAKFRRGDKWHVIVNITFSGGEKFFDITPIVII